MIIILKFIKSNSTNQKGAALVYAIVVFSVVFILSLSIMSIFSSNLKQAKYQENRMEAYYLSYSGAMMGYAAVTADANDLLTKIPVGTVSAKTQNGITLGKGKVDIKAEKSNDSLHLGWVKITSTGTLNDSNVSSKTILYVHPNNPNTVKWESF